MGYLLDAQPLAASWPEVRGQVCGGGGAYGGFAYQPPYVYVRAATACEP